MRAGDAGFHLLELRRDETLGVGKRLFANPTQPIEMFGDRICAACLPLVVIRRLRALGHTDLEVVAEHFVVPNPSAAHPGALALAQLHRGDPLASIARRSEE